MPLTPQITLTITLDDLQGNDVGAVGNPAFVEIALAGFGPTLPRIAGTSMLAKVGPAAQRTAYLGEEITVELWGNDVITPAGTYYVITIFDDQLNVLQSGAYVFNGTLSADLSTLPQAFPSAASSVMGAEVTVQPSATPEFNCGLVNGPVEFYMVLTENVSASTLLPNFAGQIVIFRIVQNATAGWSFAWPANVLNPGPVAPTAPSGGYLGASVQAFCVASDGNAYPLGLMTYN